ncbi:hypothetical protein [Pseudomonas kitaguniensis]|nr:hypothetical protein [Pseudomonas kitaguniensis]
MAPVNEHFIEKNAALEALADIQHEQDIEADQAVQDQWLAKRNAAVDRLVTLLGKQHNEILVNDSMQSGFFVNELQALMAARQVQETQVLRTLTRRVLNNHDAVQGSEV